MELLFVLFVVLLAMVGLLFIGALVSGVFFVAIATAGWIMTVLQNRGVL